ncbi:MAG: cytochrome b N-terminal domain-containing protein [Anaerolineales bacterium]
MKTVYRTILIVIGSLSLLLVTAAGVHAFTTSNQVEVTYQDSDPIVQVAPPEPEKDTCIQCHAEEAFTNIWTPLVRWILFGGTGLALLFGVARSASVWRSRSEWIPIPSRILAWIDERYQLSDFLKPILEKPVPDWQRRWWYCLGGLTFFLFVVQGITGIMLAFYYKPTPAEAYASIQFIENEVLLGSAVRMIHHWSANGMIVMATAHMLRVFIMGVYKPPRELNWVTGVVLLTLTLVFGFTGYLLPWDQRAYWATTVGTEIAGSIPVIGELALVFLRTGWSITSLTLSRFFALHILILPLVTFAFMGLHFVMVRKQGIMKPL